MNDNVNILRIIRGTTVDAVPDSALLYISQDAVTVVRAVTILSLGISMRAKQWVSMKYWRL